MQGMVTMKFEKCRCEEIVGENVKAEVSETQVHGSEQGFLVEGRKQTCRSAWLCCCVVVYQCAMLLYLWSHQLKLWI